ncbi:MAG: aminopeptidase [Saprospiraceae bacterium]|nr:aminopeptidase [Saprospiraceae bacterium]MCB9318056.1 aminopeptidase [Lewinellaceae bacterium]
MQTIENRYAQLLTQYCLDLKKGDQVYVRSTTLAEPLVREVWKEGLRLGANMVIDLDFAEKDAIYFAEADDDQLAWIDPGYAHAVNHFDAYLVIRAPFNLKDERIREKEKLTKRKSATAPVNEVYFSRTGSGAMRRTLCQYPTQAAAQEAGMTLSEYQDFVYTACRLFDDDPRNSWLQVREMQQEVVNYLNGCKQVQYLTPATDITFSVASRTWINSDGRANMPSGEVFSAPVEDSVQGNIYFSYPSVFLGQSVQGITLSVKDGWIEKWDAETGREVLDQVFAIEGSRRFGEVAIGTNYNIQQPTRNILFDEKIGGSIHMAVGQSYYQCGGKNQSAIHFDMITDMRNEGRILADGRCIYENGQFLI